MTERTYSNIYIHGYVRGRGFGSEHISADGVRTVIYADGSFTKEFPAEMAQRFIDGGFFAAPKVTESPPGVDTSPSWELWQGWIKTPNP